MVEADTISCIDLPGNAGEADACQFDGRPCLLFESVFNWAERADLSRDERPANAQELSPVMAESLPCPNCPRYCAHITSSLPGTKLGKHERHLLLNASLPDSNDELVIKADKPGRSPQEGLLRAARTLEVKGLLQRHRTREQVVYDKPHSYQLEEVFRRPSELHPAAIPVHTKVTRCAVRLTHIGQIIVERYRRRLEGGKRIRWRDVEALTMATADDVPALLRSWMGELKRREIGYLAVMSLGIAGYERLAELTGTGIGMIRATLDRRR